METNSSSKKLADAPEDSTLMIQDLTAVNDTSVVDNSATEEITNHDSLKPMSSSSSEQTLTKKSSKSKSSKDQKKEKGPYNFKASPPDIELAKIHGEACSFFKPETQKSAKKSRYKICGCCMQPYDMEKFNMESDIREFNYYGINIPIYFHFLKLSGILLSILIIFGGIYDLISNYSGDDCLKNPEHLRSGDSRYCSPSFLTRLMFVNKRDHSNLINIGDALHTIAAVLAIIGQAFIVKVIQNLINKFETETTTPASYTLMFKNIPKDTTNQELIAYLQKNFSSKVRHQVVKINRSYDIAHYINLVRRREKLKEEIEVHQKMDRKPQFEDVVKQIMLIESEKNSLGKKKVAFVTFESEEQAFQIAKLLYLDEISKLLVQFSLPLIFKTTYKIKQNILLAEPAPHPYDVVWENLDLDIVDTYKRKVRTFLLSIVITGVSFGITIALNLISDNNDEGSVIQSFYSILISVLLYYFNNGIEKATKYLAQYELHATCTNFQISIATRLAYLTFINNACVLFFSALITKTVWKSGGLGQNVFYTLIADAVTSNIWKYFDIWHYKKVYKRSELEKGGHRHMTQEEANELYRNSEFDYMSEYYDMLRGLWVACFFGVVFPLGLFISLFGLVTKYYVVKYLLITRYSKPIKLSSKFAKKMSMLMLWAPFFYLLGGIIFESLAKGEFKPSGALSILFIIFIGVYMNPCFFTIFNKISDRIEGKIAKKINFTQKTFTEVQSTFEEDYETVNPVTRQLALSAFQNALNKPPELAKDSDPSATQTGAPASVDPNVEVNTSTINQGAFQSYAFTAQGYNKNTYARPMMMYNAPMFYAPRYNPMPYPNQIPRIQQARPQPVLPQNVARPQITVIPNQNFGPSPMTVNNQQSINVQMQPMNNVQQVVQQPMNQYNSTTMNYQQPNFQNNQYGQQMNTQMIQSNQVLQNKPQNMRNSQPNLNQQNNQSFTSQMDNSFTELMGGSMRMMNNPSTNYINSQQFIGNPTNQWNPGMVLKPSNNQIGYQNQPVFK